jgi:hypothetical protein
MKNSTLSEINIQRDYYKKTSNQYNKMHTADETGEHFFALSCPFLFKSGFLFMVSVLSFSA